MSTLEQDVRTLQSQVRRQRRWNIALGALVVVGGLMAATGVRSVPDVIQAKKFEVVNDEGKVLVLMDSVFSKGERYGFVTTKNGKGQKIVAIGASADGGIVTTQNDQGVTLVRLTTDQSGNGAVLAQDAAGNIKATLP